MHPEALARLGDSSADVVRFMRAIGYVALDLDGAPVVASGLQAVVFRPA